MTKIKKGAVIRVTEWRTDTAGRNRLEEPAWGIAQQNTNSNSFEVEWIVGEPRVGDDYCANQIEFYDKYTVVPPSKWPDEICVIMAKRALLGADHG